METLIMFLVALDAPCLSPQQSKLKRSWESIAGAGSSQSGTASG